MAAALQHSKYSTYLYWPSSVAFSSLTRSPAARLERLQRRVSRLILSEEPRNDTPHSDTPHSDTPRSDTPHELLARIIGTLARPGSTGVDCMLRAGGSPCL